MKNNLHIAQFRKNFLYLSLLLLLAGCSSMVQKGGEILEGKAFSEMELALYRSAAPTIELREIRLDDGKTAVEITGSQWPGLVLRGTSPRGDGSFDLYQADILSSHVQGWNEITMDIAGRGIFSDPKKTGGILRIAGETERVQIRSGSIRLKSSRLTGDAALGRLRNRRERILALTEWMGSRAENNGEKPVFKNRKEFEDYWKSILFPELVSKSKRPPGYSAENAGRNQWTSSDSVCWNISYTENLFPEALWDYRNSGALLRDWEEALPWIFMEYSWSYIINSFSDTNLVKVR